MVFRWGACDSHPHASMLPVRGGDREGKQGQQAARAGSHPWAGGRQPALGPSSRCTHSG